MIPDNIYEFMEFITLTLYLLFVFISIQIWFLWKDTDKNELKMKIVTESFFRKNCIYVFSLSILFMIRLFEGTNPPNAMIHFEIIQMLALISLLLIAYGWYSMLKMFAHKKSLPLELTNFSKEEYN